MASDLGGIELMARDNGVEFNVKVVPGASRTKVAGLWGRALKILVAAPPEAGKANAAVSRIIADLFGVRKTDVSLVAGQTAALKRVRVAGLSPQTAQARLRRV